MAVYVVAWVSKDGSSHHATVDIGDIFKDRLIRHNVPREEIREGMSIGAKVTLRGDRMYYFVDKLFNIVLPRVRDFRGVSDKAFDGRGNYALGLKEQLIFPEINYDDVDKVRGMNIVFVTSANTDEECKELLTQLGIPFVQG